MITLWNTVMHDDVIMQNKVFLKHSTDWDQTHSLQFCSLC